MVSHKHDDDDDGSTLCDMIAIYHDGLEMVMSPSSPYSKIFTCENLSCAPAVNFDVMAFD